MYDCPHKGHTLHCGVALEGGKEVMGQSRRRERGERKSERDRREQEREKGREKGREREGARAMGERYVAV